MLPSLRPSCSSAFGQCESASGRTAKPQAPSLSPVVPAAAIVFLDLESCHMTQWQAPSISFWARMSSHRRGSWLIHFRSWAYTKCLQVQATAFISLLANKHARAAEIKAFCWATIFELYWKSQANRLQKTTFSSPRFGSETTVARI